MHHTAGNPFPDDVVVVCRRGGAAIHARRVCARGVRDAVPVGAGGSQSMPSGSASDAMPSLVLYGDGLADADLQPWRYEDALVAPAARVLNLLAPGRAPDAADADAVGLAYLDAIADMTSQLDLLRLAHDALPVRDSAERALLAHALARAAAQGLLATPAGARSGSVAPPLNALTRHAARLDTSRQSSDAADPRAQLHAHELLDACFVDVAARWQGRTGDFERREGQGEMAHAVLDAFLRRGPLVVEAGTGTGKSLAYALPAIVYAWLFGERVVISTHTRNLQQQLVAHDLPALWDCFDLERVPRPDGRRGLRFAKLLGRSNYVCRTALERRVVDTFAAGGNAEVARLVLAVLRAGDGSVDEILHGVRGELLHDVRSRRETCMGRRCRAEPACPVYRAREVARSADLVVINHALLFADARSEGSILGDYGALVLDEAHNLERVATETVGYALGHVQAERMLAPARRMESELRALAPGDEADALQKAFSTFVAHLAEARDGIVGLLDTLDGHLPMAARVRSRQRYRDADEVFGAVRRELDDVGATLFDAARCSVTMLEAAQDIALQDNGAGVLELAELLVALLHETQTTLEFVTRAVDEDWVYYLDFAAPGDALREIVAAPLDVSLTIQALLADVGACVYTSATLLVDGDSSYFRSSVGLDSSVPLVQIESPFDYTTQCRVIHTMALGDYRDAEFVPRLAALLASQHRRVGRRTLVLLTSYAMLRALHHALTAELGAQAPVLAQGVSGPRERLAQQLATTPGALLLGTRSFWEGVDLPREALEILVLAKLPFVAPDEPIVEARSERMRAHGDDPFEQLVLPEAVLRFRQGFGRLIRSQSDRGAVLLLDGRLDTRPYGESFLASLPASAERLQSATDVVERVAAWFGDAATPAVLAVGRGPNVSGTLDDG